jgi:hypothetical protein
VRIALIGLLMLATAGCGSKEYKWEMYPLGGKSSVFRMNKETGQVWQCSTGYGCIPVEEGEQFKASEWHVSKGGKTKFSSGLPISRPKK